MNPLAKTLIISGIILIVMGLIWQFGGKIFPFGRLPGDLSIKREGMEFHFPWVSCLLLSALFSLIGYLMKFFK